MHEYINTANNDERETASEIITVEDLGKHTVKRTYRVKITETEAEKQIEAAIEDPGNFISYSITAINGSFSIIWEKR